MYVSWAFTVDISSSWGDQIWQKCMQHLSSVKMVRIDTHSDFTVSTAGEQLATEIRYACGIPLVPLSGRVFDSSVVSHLADGSELRASHPHHRSIYSAEELSAVI